MYGFVIRALEQLVVREFGEEKWKSIRALGPRTLASDEEILERLIYDDIECEALIDAAVEVLGLPRKELIEKFGENFFSFCAESGYETILRSLGGDLCQFLSGLDSLHDHLSYRYPGMRAPSFRVFPGVDRDTIILDYYSERNGLEDMVVGIVKAAARTVFEVEVDVTLINASANQGQSARFLVQATTINDTNEHLLCKQNRQTKHLFGDDPTTELESVVDPETFCHAFPFHVIFSRDLTICQAGSSLVRMISGLKPGVTKFNSIFSSVRPHFIEFTFENILSRVNTVFVVKTKEWLHKLRTTSTSDEKTIVENNSSDSDEYDITDTLVGEDKSLRLKGQMMYLEESDSMLFLCSPRILSLDGLDEKGMYLSDIPIHDSTRDIILLSQQHSAEHKLTKDLEIITDKLQQTSRELEYEQKLADKLLYSILPEPVANDLRAKKPVAAKKYEIVTTMFSGIVDFGSLCNNSQEPMEIVNFLNQIYTKFDQAIDKNPMIYKVETVGDKYMAVSGLPNECNEHAHNIANLALDMHEIANAIIINGKKIEVTIGVHSGEVVAGVVGQKLPRYCLFGNTVNLTSRCETTGFKGKINVTEYAHRSLMTNPDRNWNFELRGPVTMKGRKEPMICYTLTKSRNSNVASLRRKFGFE